MTTLRLIRLPPLDAANPNRQLESRYRVTADPDRVTASTRITVQMFEGYDGGAGVFVTPATGGWEWAADLRKTPKGAISLFLRELEARKRRALRDYQRACGAVRGAHRQSKGLL